MPSLRTPSTWAPAQRAFHLAYLADPAAFERHEVVLSWADGGDAGGGAIGIARVFGRLFSGRSQGPEVTVLTLDDALRSMRFPVDLERAPGPEVTDVATLVGEIGTNAVCCLELAGSVVWPSYNPVELVRPT